MSIRNILKALLICVGLLVVFLVSTRPSSLSPIFLIVPFLLVFIILFLGFLSIFKWRKVQGSRSLWLPLLLAALPTILLAMQSLGQLSLRDIITILFIFIVVYAYVSRVTKKP